MTPRTSWGVIVAWGGCLVMGLTGPGPGRLEAAAAALPPAGLKPDILFIFADDQCFETVRALGDLDIDTPHLDRLAARGTVFRRAYNMGSWSGAVCVASRTMLNTGRFVWRANRIYQNTEQERQAGRFWSEHLRKAGYGTYMTGKWHVQTKAARAFDRVEDVRGGMPNQTPQGYNRPLAGREDPWKPWDTQFGGFWEGGKHWSEVVADHAQSFLREASAKEQPFFMYLAFNAVHDPRQSPREYVDRYPLDRVELPVNFLPLYPYKDAIGCGPELRDEKLAPFPRTAHAVKVHRQEYFALVTHMDDQIGRILEALKESGREDRTYIFFTADHGLAVGHHGLVGKQNMYEHSLRVPFIVSGPGIPRGSTIDTPIYLQDVMPTTLELAGIPRPDHVEFKSLLPLLRGEKVTPYASIYGAYLKLQRMVIDGDYKLILYPKISRARLFNLKEDPEEMTDLAGRESARPVVKRLFARLLELQAEMEDDLDLRKAFPTL